MRDTILRTPEQLGRAIRLKRLEKGLSQRDLAARLGLERKWVIRLEAGNPKAELGAVLRALELLDIQPTLSDEDSLRERSRRPAPSRLDEVFRRLQRSERK